MITQEGYNKFISETQAEHKARFEADFKTKKETKKMRFTSRYIDEPNAYHQIELIVPRHDLTIEEAKQLLDSLTAEVEIAEWNEKRSATEKNHWSQDYLESFNDDGLSVD